VKEALDMGVPIPTIAAAMNERILSGKKELREKLSKKLSPSNKSEIKANAKSPLERGAPIGVGCVAPEAENTLRLLSQPPLSRGDSPQLGLGELFLFARLTALAEGFDLIKTAADNYGWKIDRTQVAQLWRGGCIIRSDMLKMFMDAFEKEPTAQHFFQTKVFADFMRKEGNEILKLYSEITAERVATPSLSAAMNYYKSLTTNHLSINLIQAQRDYFGAHTYRRLDNRDEPFHTEWKS